MPEPYEEPRPFDPDEYEPWPYCRSCETYHDPGQNYVGDCVFDWDSIS